jgi:hypothetical protein
MKILHEKVTGGRVDGERQNEAVSNELTWTFCLSASFARRYLLFPQYRFTFVIIITTAL